MVSTYEGNNQTQEALAALLHDRNCPMGYNCQAADCVECLERSLGKEVAGNAAKD